MNTGPSLRGDSHLAEDPYAVQVLRQAKIARPFQAYIAQNGEPTRQTVKSIHPIPVTTAKEKERERTKVTNGKPLKGAKKGKQKDSGKAASSTRDHANASPEPYEATVPDWDEWYSYYADQGWRYAHTTSNSLTRMQHLPRTERDGKRTTTEQKDHQEEAQIRIRAKIVPNSCDSFHSLI